MLSKLVRHIYVIDITTQEIHYLQSAFNCIRIPLKNGNFFNRTIVVVKTFVLTLKTKSFQRYDSTLNDANFVRKYDPKSLVAAQTHQI